MKLPFNISTFLSSTLYTCQKRRATTNITILQAVFLLSCLRKISKISCKDEVKSDKILRRAEVQTSKQRRGHILRQPVRWLIKVSMDWIPHAEKRASGRTWKTCWAIVIGVLRKRVSGVFWNYSQVIEVWKYCDPSLRSIWKGRKVVRKVARSGWHLM